MSHEPGAPSPWVVRFAPVIPAGGQVLDLACGRGRHTRLLLEQGYAVVAADRDLSGLADLDHPRLEKVEVDLEDGRPFPFLDRRFAGVVVTNYLYRPILSSLVAAVGPQGLLIYETFAAGNERFGPPTNPDFLLEPGELLRVVRSRLSVVAFEDVVVSEPRSAAVQRVAATRRTS